LTVLCQPGDDEHQRRPSPHREHVEGTVASANHRGVKLTGHDDYFNFSSYADPPIAAPRHGQRIRIGLGADRYIRELQIVSTTSRSHAPADERDGVIARSAVLKAAANFLGLMSQTREEVKSDHVLLLAEKWLAWVEREPRQQLPTMASQPGNEA
jgi:hypothetical protein